jgi:hypothetical protein
MRLAASRSPASRPSPAQAAVAAARSGTRATQWIRRGPCARTAACKAASSMSNQRRRTGLGATAGSMAMISR